LLAVFILLSAAYVGQRVANSWLIGDALNLTRASQISLEQGTISPTAYVYRFGFAYPSLNVFLAHLTGLSIETIQTYLQPFLVVLLVPVAYIAFARLAANRLAALFATLLLFLQADFFFEVTRSSHAKLTWLLALTMLYILASSFERIQSGSSPIWWILLFYPVALALIATNSFFASSYILGIALAFVGLQLLRWLPITRDLTRPPGFRRLLYITLSGTILVFLFIFYLYPPARLQFITLRTTVDRLAALLLGLENIGFSPYAYVTNTWLSVSTYITLTLLNYLVVVVSFIAWFRLAFLIVVKRQGMPAGRYLLWLLYPSFALILAISVALDFSGILSQNLQVRLFPNLMVVAIPLAALLVVDLLTAIRARNRVSFSVASAVLAIVVIFFAGAGLLKVTNDPLLSNRWLFYTRSEQLAMDWADERLVDTAVWTGLERRLELYADFFTEWAWHGVEPLPGRHTQEERHFLLSDIIRAHAARVGATLPDVRYQQQVYDNGGAQLYYRRPATPYQR
jgi:hypothetical protein